MPQYLHISARLATTMLPNGTLQTYVVRPGSTFNIGSKQRKRARFAAKKAAKAQRRAAARLSIDQRYEAHLAACDDFDAMKREQEARAA